MKILYGLPFSPTGSALQQATHFLATDIASAMTRLQSDGAGRDTRSDFHSMNKTTELIVILCIWMICAIWATYRFHRIHKEILHSGKTWKDYIVSAIIFAPMALVATIPPTDGNWKSGGSDYPGSQ